MEAKNAAAKLKELFSGEKGKKLIVLLGLLGIALIGLSSLLKPQESAKEETMGQESGYSHGEYGAKLEKRLSEVVAAITGDTQPTVMITLESSSEYIYAIDEQTSTQKSGEESVSEESDRAVVIVMDTDGAEHPVTVLAREPEIRGVVVVTNSSLSKSMEEKLINAVKTATGVSSAKVCVINS